MKKPVIVSETDRNWLKYCGFLDLTIEQFMSIQESLLRQQLETVRGTSLWRKIVGENIPRNLTEYRRMVPLTRYEEYLPELLAGNENALGQKPLTWAKNSGSGNSQRTVPVTETGYQKQLEHLMAVFILACSQGKGRSSLAQGDRISINSAAAPSLPGILVEGVAQAFKMQRVKLSQLFNKVGFKEKTNKSLAIFSASGMDVVVGLSGELIKAGREFDEQFRRGNFAKPGHNPAAIYRFARAFWMSKSGFKPVFPKDIWVLKALICWGLDTEPYRQEIYRYWGCYPFQFYACTEAGVIAVQSWTRAGLTFVPDSNFYEFIPEEEINKEAADRGYEPQTVLLNEVKPGRKYELVITNFFGMPFLRYRPGHLLRITALEDNEAGIALPQMLFESRADDLIDLAGITRIGQNAINQALKAAGVMFEDWVARCETYQGNPVLHVYVEIRGQAPEQLELQVESHLAALDAGFRELNTQRQPGSLRVTLLNPGSFRRYSLVKQAAGDSLARQRPRRMNPGDEEICELTGRQVLLPAVSSRT